MKFHAFAAALLLAALAHNASAQIEIQWWHSMGGDLGDWVRELAEDFNASQQDYQVVPAYKGSYDESLSSALAALRAGHAPDILQQPKLACATLAASEGRFIPLAEVMKQGSTRFDPAIFLPGMTGFDARRQGLSLPFNSFSAVLFYNKDALKAAGLDPDKPPGSWAELAQAAAKLKAGGSPCAFTSSWLGWTQLESYAKLHQLSYVSKNEAADEQGARLSFNSPPLVRHMERLAQMARQGLLLDKGRGNAADASFVSGECALLTTASSLDPNLRKNAKFSYGIAPLPFDPDVAAAPQNSAVDGASLWVLAGQPATHYRGVAAFFNYLTRPEVDARSHQRTGYLPLTQAAYALSQQSGFYTAKPGSDVAVQQMMRKTREEPNGVCLGRLAQIRNLVNEEMEEVWAGKKSAKDGLDAAVKRGNEQLERFQQAHRR